MFPFFLLLCPLSHAQATPAEAARTASREALTVTLGKLKTPDAATYSAIERWFKVKPADSGYASTMSQVTTTVASLSGMVGTAALPLDNACPAEAFGCASKGVPTVHLTSLWAASGPLCQRSVVMHEVGHVIGLQHTYVDPKLGEAGGLKPTVQMTTAESLKNANSFAQLVSQVAWGVYDACDTGA